MVPIFWEIRGILVHFNWRYLILEHITTDKIYSGPRKWSISGTQPLHTVNPFSPFCPRGGEHSYAERHEALYI